MVLKEMSAEIQRVCQTDLRDLYLEVLSWFTKMGINNLMANVALQY